MMQFEWDDRKAAATLKKHGVLFREAGTIFEDPMAITFRDPGHPDTERWFLTFGLSQADHYWWWRARPGPKDANH